MMIEHKVEYNAFINMKQRCLNKEHPEYFRYGGRGIVVEESLDTFEKFFIALGEKPDKSFSLDRINPAGNYSAENCRWASKTIQSFNQKTKKTNKTGIAGVQFREKFNTYRVYISIHRKRIHLGSTADFFEACCIRKSAELRFYGEEYED